MESDFNPYREWLGWAGAAPDHYALLGLPRFEADAAAIAAAAERVTARIRSIRPGPHAIAWSQLLDDIAAAKACLCDAQGKLAYDQSLRAPGHAPRNSPATTARSALAGLQGELYPPGMAPAKPVPKGDQQQRSDKAQPQMQFAAADRDLSDLLPPGAAAPKNSSAQLRAKDVASAALPGDVDPMAPVFLPVGDPMAAVPVATVDKPLEATVLEAEVVDRPAWQAASSRAPTSFRRTSRRGSPLGLLAVAIGSGLFLAGAVMLFVGWSRLRTISPPVVANVPAETVNLPAESVNPVPTPTPSPAPPAEPRPKKAPRKSRSSPPAIVPAPASESPAARTDSAPPPPTPAAPPTPAPPSQASRAEIEALVKTLEAARAALGEQDFTAADGLLTQAEALAKLPQHAEAVARLREVGKYAQQFRAAIGAAVAGMQPGESFQVGSSTQVGFVSGSADEITLRLAGSNRRFRLNDLPPQLALELSEFKLDAKSPAGHVIQGAYLLLHKQPDDTLKQQECDRARTMWEEAQGVGADIAHLLPFLTDNYANLIKDATNTP